MKKLLLFFAFLFCITSSFSQSNYYVKGGVALPKFSSDIMLGDNSSFFIYPEVGATFKVNRRLNFNAGVGIKTFIFKDEGFVTGMKVTVVNGDTTYTPNSGTSTERTILLNVAVPLYLTYNFDLRYSRTNLFLAFDFGYEPGLDFALRKSTQNQNIDLNLFTSNIIFGVRVGRTISRYREIEAGFRYCYGLQDLTKFPQFGADVFQLMLGMTFER
jgi:hypothetical protein